MCVLVAFGIFPRGEGVGMAVGRGGVSVSLWREVGLVVFVFRRSLKYSSQVLGAMESLGSTVSLPYPFMSFIIFQNFFGSSVVSSLFKMCLRFSASDSLQVFLYCFLFPISSCCKCLLKGSFFRWFIARFRLFLALKQLSSNHLAGLDGFPSFPLLGGLFAVTKDFLALSKMALLSVFTQLSTFSCDISSLLST